MTLSSVKDDETSMHNSPEMCQLSINITQATRTRTMGVVTWKVSECINNVNLYPFIHLSIYPFIYLSIRYTKYLGVCKAR